MFHKLAHDIYTAALIKLAFKANQNNFTHGTSAVFSKTTKRPDREPDKKSPKKGSNSEYWVTPMGIIRGSDHWGTVGTCNWNLAGSPDHPGKKVYGFSPWENFEKKSEYDPPLNADQIRELKGEEILQKLINDPAHKFRMDSGIELIHKEPSLDELNRIMSNWEQMTDEQKALSDTKSMELFGLTNKDNYNQLIHQ